jgi:MHS family shikimate/dehydroshikimate transporter-like MFS transporter
MTNSATSTTTPESEGIAPWRRKIRRTIVGASVGNIIEQYDFVIYGSLAALAFGTLFFNQMSTTDALLASFSVYAVGFVARPLGGLIAGHFGDLYGRKRVLLIMLFIAGVSTTLIGLLPTRETVGVWAPILLVVLRFIQGASFGGEYGGAVLIVNESSPARRRGFYTSFIPASTCLAVIFANLAVLSVSLLPESDFLSWGWRVPFLAAFTLVVVGLVLRMRLTETDAFRKINQEGTVDLRRRPLIEAFKENRRSLLLMALMCWGYSTVVYMIIVWSLSYLHATVHVAAHVGLVGVLVGSAFQAVSTVAASALSDRIGRRPVIIMSATLFALIAFPMFLLFNSGRPTLVWIAFAVAMTVSGMVHGPLSSLIAELFATKHRYSGVSTSYQVGFTLGGGLSPLIATSLIAWTGTWSSIACYMLLGALACVIAAVLLPETAGRALGAAAVQGDRDETAGHGG